MYDKKIRKMLTLAGMSVVLTASALQGCGGKESSSGSGDTTAETTKAADGGAKTEETKEDLTKDMKEFTMKDGSMSLMLNKDWEPRAKTAKRRLSSCSSRK